MLQHATSTNTSMEATVKNVTGPVILAVMMVTHVTNVTQPARPATTLMVAQVGLMSALHATVELTRTSVTPTQASVLATIITKTRHMRANSNALKVAVTVRALGNTSA